MDWTAGATLALAVATVALVYFTYLLAKQGGEDVRAQWRPVLLVRSEDPRRSRDAPPLHAPPIPLAEFVFPQPPIGCTITGDQCELTVLVENVGRGPALEVRPVLDGYTLPTPGLGTRAGAEKGDFTAMAPGEFVYFEWQLQMAPGFVEAGAAFHVSGQLAYTDVATASYATRFIVSGIPSTPKLVWQGIESFGMFKFAWWQRITPRPLRKYLRPLSNRYMRKRYGIELPAEPKKPPAKPEGEQAN